MVLLEPGVCYSRQLISEQNLPAGTSETERSLLDPLISEAAVALSADPSRRKGPEWTAVIGRPHEECERPHVGPPDISPRCDPRFGAFIDHIGLDRRAAADFRVFSDAIYATSVHASDHCPIAVTLSR